VDVDVDVDVDVGTRCGFRIIPTAYCHCRFPVPCLPSTVSSLLSPLTRLYRTTPARRPGTGSRYSSLSSSSSSSSLSPALPVLPFLPVATARISPHRRVSGGADRGAASPPRLHPRTRRGRRVYPAGHPVLMPIRPLGHPAWRTTCASGFECADPDALSIAGPGPRR
jgi:hypothetical protein